MHLFRLTPDIYHPSDTVQKFESLAWIERYREAGDFQLRAIDDTSILDILPIDSLVSHTDTREVMIVENHEIIRDPKKRLLVTISGRSLETMAENRTTPDSQLPFWNATQTVETPVVIFPNDPATVAALILQMRFQGAPPAYVGNPLEFYFYAPTGQIVPNIICYASLDRPKDSANYPMKRGELYKVVLELLASADAGIKVNRPITNPALGSEPKLYFVVYDGEDLTEEVVFYAAREDLDSATYFQSHKGYKNYATIAALRHSIPEYQSLALTAPEVGFKRRILYVEAQDLKMHPDNYVPDVNGPDAVSTRAQGELDHNGKISLMDAKISITAKPKFKIDYDVGDLVSVFGEFGTKQIFRVSEHILTVDKDGQKGYPTLSIATL